MAIDSIRKNQGTFIEHFLAHIMGIFGYHVELHQSNRDKSNRQEAALAMCPEYGSFERLIMPDMTCWKLQHPTIIEVKSKTSTRFGSYGLDVKRFDYLKRYQKITGGIAWYVIYDMDLSKGKLNDPNAFLFAALEDLDLINKHYIRDCYYWSTDLFIPLVSYLDELEFEPTITQPQRPAWHDYRDPADPSAPSVPDARIILKEAAARERRINLDGELDAHMREFLPTLDPADDMLIDIFQSEYRRLNIPLPL